MYWKKYGITSPNIFLTHLSMFLGGFIFFLPFLSLYFETQLFTITNVTLLLSIQSLALLLFEVPSGALADLFGKKKTIICSNIMILLSFVFLYIGGSMTILIFYAIINSFARSLSSGTDTALIFETLKSEGKEHYYKKVIGTYHALWPIGASLGSIIGSYLAQISLSATILATFIPFSLLTFLSFFLKEPHPIQKPEQFTIFNHIFQSFSIAFSKKQLVFLLFIGFLLTAFSETLHLLNSLFFDFKAIPLVFFGWLSAIIFFFSSLGHYFSHVISEKLGNKYTLILCTIGMPLTLLAATYSFGYLSGFIFTITSFFFGLQRPIIDHLINIHITSQHRVTILSLANFFNQLGIALFAPCIGLLIDLYTITIAFQFTAFFLFSVPIICLFLKKVN